MLDFFKNFAVSPDDLPDVVFASIGRTVWRDIGATAVGFRLMMKARHRSLHSLSLAICISQNPSPIPG